MQNLSDLRQYYNHTIHPELKRMETKRHNLLMTLWLSFMAIMGIVFMQFYFKNIVLTLVLIIPLVLYVSYIFSEWESFRTTFKPRVITLLLDFIDNDVTYNVPLKYVENGAIPRSVFAASRLFNASAPDYVGEDYIKGEMGELDFELSELSVKDFSPVRNRLDDVFRGVFLHARFRRDVQPEKGEILVLPRSKRQLLSKTIKTFTIKGGRQFEYNLSQKFTDTFVVYATADANTKGFLSENMQESILKYREKEGNEIYLSFIKNSIYVAVSQEKDLLEPALWQSNMSFDLIREFYEDITLLLSIVLNIVANN